MTQLDLFADGITKHRDRPACLRGIDAALVDRFLDYHAEHPAVFDEFVRRALQMRRSGREKYSAWSIINVIRSHHDLNTSGEFRINNDYIACYARLAMVRHPIELEGFFELRATKPHDRRRSDEERYRAK